MNFQNVVSSTWAKEAVFAYLPDYSRIFKT